MYMVYFIFLEEINLVEYIYNIQTACCKRSHLPFQIKNSINRFKLRNQTELVLIWGVYSILAVNMNEPLTITSR